MVTTGDVKAASIPKTRVKSENSKDWPVALVELTIKPYRMSKYMYD